MLLGSPHQRLVNRAGLWVGILLLLNSTSELSANGPEVGRDAGMIFPVASDSVQLVTEYVVVRIPSDVSEAGQATCYYTLRNLASTRRDFEMAFVAKPQFAPSPEEYRRGYEGAAFEVVLDGSPLEVRYAPIARGAWTAFAPDAPDSLPVWRVAMDPGATRDLKMRYLVTWTRGLDGDESGAVISYRARAAALWADRVLSASIRFELDPLAARVLQCAPPSGSCFQLSLDPPGYRWKHGAVEWEFTNWEPDTDFSFGYHTSVDTR